MTTFRTYLRIIWAHKAYLLVYLVMLSVVSVLMGLGSGGTPAEGTGDDSAFRPTQVRVAVIDRDGTTLSQALTGHVLEGNQEVDVADDSRAIADAMARDTASYLLVIPSGWQDGLLQAAHAGTDAPNLQTYVSYSSAEGRLLDVETVSYADALYGFAATLGSADLDDAATTGTVSAAASGTADDALTKIVEAADAAWQSDAKAVVMQRAASPLPDGLATAARFASYPLFAAITVSIAVLMKSLNDKPVRDRGLASPQSAGSRNAALLGTCVVVALVSWAVNFGMDVVVLGDGALARSPVQLALVGAALLVYALVSAAIGFLLGTLGISENAANAIANILGMAMSVLGGAWTGLSLLPDSLVAVARFTPAYWVSLVVDRAMGMSSVSGDAVATLLGYLGICALFGVAAATAGLVAGRTRARKQLT
ncbi:MAG: ABC transporter permease [Atopobiaceae bacterium]